MPSGVYLDNGYTVAAALKHLAVGNTDTGTSSGSYSGARTARNVVNKQPTKAGVSLSTYAPKLSAILAGEFL